MTFSPSNCPHYYGDIISVQATPSAGFTFSGWSFDSNVNFDPANLSSLSTTVQINGRGNTILNANFNVITYSGLVVNPLFGGTIVLGNYGPYQTGDTTSITAWNNDGWSFCFWSLQNSAASYISDSLSFSANLHVYDDFTLTADFTEIVSTVTGSNSPTGAGIVTINGSPTATGTIGQTISLVATPYGSNSFVNWTVVDVNNNDYSSSVNNSFSSTTFLTIPDMGSVSDMNLTVTASYSLAPYTITVNQSASGTVTVSPSQAIYHYGDTVSISASPGAGYLFGGWTVSGGMVSANTGSDSLAVQGNVTLAANFPPPPISFTLWTSSNWVYQNTAITTSNRHYLAMTTSVTGDTWGNNTYTATVAVSPTPSGTYLGLIPSSTYIYFSGGNNIGSITPTTGFTFAAGSTGTLYLIGGPVLGGGLVNSAENKAVAGPTNGQYTVTVTVVGDQSGSQYPAVTTWVVNLRILGDVDGNGTVQAADKAWITQKIAGGTSYWPDGVDPTALDVDGNGTVQSADKVIVTYGIGGTVIP